MMSTVAVGVDVVDVARFALALERRPRLIDRLFTASERVDARERPERLAARFAAKEAVLKALGSGLGDASFQSIEVRRAPSGAPEIVLHDETYAGADRAGREAVDALHDEGVDSLLVRLDPLVPTNRNFVLRVGHERTILVHHEQHDCHWPYLRPADVPSWLFLSSVGRDASAYEHQIADWLDANPQVSLAFEPGTLQIARGARALARHYRRAALVVCNREEAAMLTGVSPDEAPAVLLDGMLALGPERVVVTDGSAGAFGSDGTRYLEVPVFPDDAPVVDRTGAGDAFAAALVAAVASGRTLEEAMLRAPVNSMRAVQQVGTQAGLLRADALEAILAAAPPGYGVRELSR